MTRTRRFIERGKGADTIRLFTPEEIRLALAEIERLTRSSAFVDPVRIRMYKRYLRQAVGMTEDQNCYGSPAQRDLLKAVAGTPLFRSVPPRHPLLGMVAYGKTG